MPPKIRCVPHFHRVNLTIVRYLGVICPEVEVVRHAADPLLRLKHHLCPQYICSLVFESQRPHRIVNLLFTVTRSNHQVDDFVEKLTF